MLVRCARTLAGSRFQNRGGVQLSFIAVKGSRGGSPGAAAGRGGAALRSIPPGPRRRSSGAAGRLSPGNVRAVLALPFPWYKVRRLSLSPYRAGAYTIGRFGSLSLSPFPIWFSLSPSLPAWRGRVWRGGGWRLSAHAGGRACMAWRGGGYAAGAGSGERWRGVKNAAGIAPGGVSIWAGFHLVRR